MTADQAERLRQIIKELRGNGYILNFPDQYMLLADAAERALALEVQCRNCGGHVMQLPHCTCDRKESDPAERPERTQLEAALDVTQRNRDALFEELQEANAAVARLTQENAALLGQRMAVSAALDARKQECKALREKLQTIEFDAIEESERE